MKLFLLLFSIPLFYVFPVLAAGQVIITWQANNFYPSNFMGKPLATPYTPVLVSTEVIKDEKFLDINQAHFTWSVDDRVVKKGIGFKEILFNVNTVAGDSLFVRVIIQVDNLTLESSTRIPIYSPLTVIENSHPLKSVKGGEQTIITAIPYFFNVQSFYDLNFSWVANNQQQEGINQNQLLLNVSQPSAWTPNVFFVNLIVQNRTNPLEFKEERLKFKAL
jgi:hypothetical protein